MFSLLIIISEAVNCQESKSITISTIAEELAADESAPVSDYIERLHDLAEEPVNLNSAGEDELSRLFFLTSFQVKALADYIHASGRIYSVYEIAGIPGFDRETAEMLVPFISLKEVLTRGSDTVKIHSSLLSSFTFRSTASDTSFQGSGVRFLGRYRFASGAFSGGITAEKDPGEKFLTGKPRAPDFLSAFMSYSGRGILKKLYIGDFSARFGMGSNVNTGLRMGLPLTFPGNNQAKNEIRQYTSTDENNFFRGVAVGLGFGGFCADAFWSVNRVDATTASFSGDSIDHIESFYTSGIHNTGSALNKKDAVRVVSAGVNISFSSGDYKAGIAYSADRLSLPLVKESYSPGELFDFRGDWNYAGSFYYSALVGRFLFSGEISFDKIHNSAFVQAISARLSDRLQVNLAYRKLGEGYFSMHGSVPGIPAGWFGSSTTGSFVFEAAKHVFVSGGCELRHHTWLRYRLSSPSSDSRQELKLKYIPSDEITFEALVNYRSSVTDSAESKGIPGQDQKRTGYLRVSAKYSPGSNSTLGLRADYKHVSNGERGMLLSCDASIRFRRLPLALWCRYCIFSTDGWDSRIYTYENDLLYSYSIPALSGEGSRSFVMIKYEIGRFADLRIKYGITSIAEENETACREELKLQARIVF